MSLTTDELFQILNLFGKNTVDMFGGTEQKDLSIAGITLPIAHWSYYFAGILVNGQFEINHRKKTSSYYKVLLNERNVLLLDHLNKISPLARAYGVPFYSIGRVNPNIRLVDFDNVAEMFGKKIAYFRLHPKKTEKEDIFYDMYLAAKRNAFKAMQNSYGDCPTGERFFNLGMMGCPISTLNDDLIKLRKSQIRDESKLRKELSKYLSVNQVESLSRIEIYALQRELLGGFLLHYHNRKDLKSWHPVIIGRHTLSILDQSFLAFDMSDPRHDEDLRKSVLQEIMRQHNFNVFNHGSTGLNSVWCEDAIIRKCHRLFGASTEWYGNRTPKEVEDKIEALNQNGAEKKHKEPIRVEIEHLVPRVILDEYNFPKNDPAWLLPFFNKDHDLLPTKGDNIPHRKIEVILENKWASIEKVNGRLRIIVDRVAEIQSEFSDCRNLHKYLLDQWKEWL